MQISYSKLFSVELLHEYSSSGKSTEFELLPAEDTKALFQAQHMVWKTFDNLLTVFIKENENGEPFLNSPPAKTYRTSNKEKVFRLYLRLRKPHFLNYTNLSTAFYNRERLLFTNLAGNKRNDILYLSKKIEDIGAGGYAPGDLVMKAGSDEVYEAIKVQAAGAVKPVSNTDFWVLKKGRKQYPAYKTDGIRFTGGSYLVKLNTPSGKAETAIHRFNFNAAAPTYNVPVRYEKQYFEEATDEVLVNFAGLPPGTYSVDVNGESCFVYYDAALERENIFAVIEIYNHLPASNTYAFLDANEKIKSKRYVLQFPNRRVLWKYTRKNNKATKVEDTAATNPFTFSL